MPGSVAPDARTALVLTDAHATPPAAAVIRHASAAARAQAGACSCCRTPSDLVAVLRRLVIERASGTVDFAAVIVEAAPSSLSGLAAEALADPVVAAHYAIAPP